MRSRHDASSGSTKNLSNVTRAHKRWPYQATHTQKTISKTKVPFTHRILSSSINVWTNRGLDPKSFPGHKAANKCQRQDTTWSTPGHVPSEFLNRRTSRQIWIKTLGTSHLQKYTGNCFQSVDVILIQMSCMQFGFHQPTALLKPAPVKPSKKGIPATAWCIVQQDIILSPQPHMFHTQCLVQIHEADANIVKWLCSTSSPWDS